MVIGKSGFIGILTVCSELQSILPLLMLMGGGGTEKGEQEAMNNMLPMLLMMMDDNEVDQDGNVVCVWTLTWL